MERFNEDLPVAYSKAHGVSHKDHCDNGILAEFFVAVDTITDGKLASSSDGSTKDTHGKYKTKPVNLVGGSNTPQEKCSWDTYQQSGEQPKSEFRLHDAFVATSLPDDKPVAKEAGVHRTVKR